MAERTDNKRTERDITSNRTENRSSVPNDLPDSEHDAERLQAEETFIDLPDVKDIPGQEFVHAPPLGALGDTTISSDDEEGVGVFELDDSEDPTAGTEGDVNARERKALDDDDYIPTRDENNLRRASLDNTDFEGESLNERGFGDERSGRDLDIPISETDDKEEAIGEEDEENNHYSLGSDDNDNITEVTP